MVRKAVMRERHRVASLIGLVAMEDGFDRAFDEYIAEGVVGPDGELPVIAVAADDLVWDAMRLAGAAPAVIFATSLQEREVTLVGMFRAPITDLTPVRSMKLGTTVREWFKEMASDDEQHAYRAEHVPDSVPGEWVAKSAARVVAVPTPA